MIVVAYTGATLFGFVIGWITSRLLARRAGSAHITQFAAVVAATGGGYVAVESGDRGLFGLYAIGLTVGFAGYAAVFHRLHNDKNKTAALLGVDSTDLSLQRPCPARRCPPGHLAGYGARARVSRRGAGTVL